MHPSGDVDLRLSTVQISEKDPAVSSSNESIVKIMAKSRLESVAENPLHCNRILADLPKYVTSPFGCISPQMITGRTSRS